MSTTRPLLRPITTLRLATPHILTKPTLRTVTTTPSLRSKDPNMPTTPPAHKMVHFPGLASEVRAFGQFRKVLHTGLYSQLVSMEIPVGGDIGDEVHMVDQVLLFTSGVGRAVVAGEEKDIKASDVVIVPAGTQHQFYNTSKTQPLEVVTVYSPAEHNSQTVHKTKEEGDAEEESGKDEAPEWSQQSKGENEKQELVKASGGPYEGGDDGRHEKS